jgi:hypothetical protein
MSRIFSIPLKLPHLAGGALLLALALAPVEAVAQAAASTPTPPPEVRAVAYAPIPAGSSFEVQSNDDSELSQEGVNRVQAELPLQGYAATTGAPLVMQVEIDLVRGDRQDDPLGQVQGHSNEAPSQARLFSTTENSLLNPKRPIGSADRIFRISLSVYERASGLYVWRGTATRSDPNIDTSQAGNEMINALIATVGKSMNPPPGAVQ